jgi:hypothetical protein
MLRLELAQFDTLVELAVVNGYGGLTGGAGKMVRTL